MKPLKLTMSAFGPYAEIETIDFTKLIETNIFLITGPTGAGKTTIFDGISYAIYGKSSGLDREQDHFRSDFAQEDVLTYVELEFELKGKKYVIKRIPKQIRKKARGEGFKEQKTDAELKCIEEDVMVTGALEVDRKIKEILGITHSQFRQIVMIPQGEFRELLLADSKDREEIFRKIFGTEAFEKIQRKLDEQAKEIYKEINILKEKRDTHIYGIESNEYEELYNLIHKDFINCDEILVELEKTIEEDEIIEQKMNNQLKEFDEEMNKIQNKIVLGKDINEKFKQKEDLEKEKVKLENRQEEIKQFHYKIENAKKTILLKPLEENTIKQVLMVEHKKKEVEIALKNQIQKEKEYVLAEQQLQVEQEKQSEKIKLISSIEKHKSYMDKVIQYEDKKQSYIFNMKKLEEIFSQLEKRKEKIHRLKTEIKRKGEELEESRHASKEYIKLEREIEKEVEGYEKIEVLLPHIIELGSIRKNYVRQKKMYEEEQLHYNVQKEKVVKMEDAFYKGFAGILAKGLQSNFPCPVCGSSHHPSPAPLDQELLTQEEIKKEKEKLEEWETRFKERRQELERLKAEGIAKKDLVDALQGSLKEIMDDAMEELEKDKIISHLQSKMKAMKEKIKELKQQIQLFSEKQKKEKEVASLLEEYTKKLEKEENILEQEKEEYTKKYGIVQSEKNWIDTIEKDIPNEILSKNILIEMISKLEKQYIDMEKTFKEEKENQEQCRINYMNAVSERNLKEEALKESLLEKEKEEERFHLEMVSLGFESKEKYELAKLEEKEILFYENEVAECDEKVKSNKDRYEYIWKELKGKDIVHLEKLQEDLLQIKSHKEEMNHKVKNIFAKVKKNKGILYAVQEFQEKIKEKEKDYGVMGELAKIAKGDNAQKLTFERYVLASYFDDIIEAANIRLGKMTNHRYEMNRIQEKGKGNGQSGLEIEVFDNYTGKTRHAKTLSGGESFKASLALALGLADVVQSNAGGIALDTMFIDEGFGTLDTVSLDHAIQCLIELQTSGRLVGIISHVQELKDRIAVRLEIETGLKGSKAKFNF